MRSRRAWALVASFLLVSGCGSRPAAPPALSNTPRTLPSNCDGLEGVSLDRLSDAAWAPVRPSSEVHEELRGGPSPQNPPSLRLSASAVHHVSNQSSVLARRDQAGRWVLDRVDRSGAGGLVDMPEKREASTKTLSAEQSAEIDGILAGPCLYAEPTRLDPLTGGAKAGLPSYCSQMVWFELEVSTSTRSRTAVQYCGSWGVTGRLIRLMLG